MRREMKSCKVTITLALINLKLIHTIKEWEEIDYIKDITQ